MLFLLETNLFQNLASGIPFVTIYDPNVKKLRKLIRDVFPFFTMVEKFKRFSHLFELYPTELQEKQKIV